MFLIKWRAIIYAKVLQKMVYCCVFNIIDCACINAYIIYSEVTKTTMPRREFLLQLIKEMCCYTSKSEDDVSASPTAASTAASAHHSLKQAVPITAMQK